MNLNLRGWMLALVTVVGLMLSGEARAQSCGTFMQDTITWMSQSGAYIYVKGSSHNASQAGGLGLVSSVEGWITTLTQGYTVYDPFSHRYVTVPSKLSGQSLAQTFSDRFAAGSQPFDKNQADLLNISIDANGRIVITLVTWGNNQVTIDPSTCANGLIYGFSSDGTLWSFNFVKEYLG